MSLALTNFLDVVCMYTHTYAHTHMYMQWEIARDTRDTRDAPNPRGSL